MTEIPGILGIMQKNDPNAWHKKANRNSGWILRVQYSDSLADSDRRLTSNDRSANFEPYSNFLER